MGGMLGAIMEHPEDLYPLVKLKMAASRIEKQIPAEEHWAFSYTMLQRVSRSFALVIQQLGPELRNAVCIFYLVLRALDTVEDDTSIPSEIKVPILESFYRHIYDRAWHFSCGTKDYKVLMDKFHLVSTAFLELGQSYQEAIEDITRRMGAGMAKFICKEVETIDDYDEYCHYVAGLVGLGLSKLFHASGSEDLSPDSLTNSMGLFLQKTNIIRDYLEDINEIPKSRMFWPREIWSKYANKLEDFKCEENFKQSVQCLNDMVTNALMHAEDCLLYMSSLKDLAIFRFCAIPQIMAIGTLALCYNNVEVFKGVVKMRRGLVARVINQTNDMSDIYGAFYEFSSLLECKTEFPVVIHHRLLTCLYHEKSEFVFVDVIAKVPTSYASEYYSTIDEKDPNATLTHKRTEAIKKACVSSGLLNKRKIHFCESKSRFSSVLVMVVLLLPILLALLLIKL